MSTSREIACVFYECEHSCLKGKEGTFKKACQICKYYVPRKGGSFIHQNLKKQKIEKIREYDMKQTMRDYKNF